MIQAKPEDCPISLRVDLVMESNLLVGIKVGIRSRREIENSK